MPQCLVQVEKTIKLILTEAEALSLLRLLQGAKLGTNDEPVRVAIFQALKKELQ